MIESYEILKSLKLDPVPNYLLNYISCDINGHKSSILESPKISEIIGSQWEDGSWGRFHSMDTSSKSNMTTEKALRILLNMGFKSDDEVIEKTVRYMEDHLDGLVEFRDYREKKHDWDLLTRLFAATWLLRIDSNNKKANIIADKWAKVITKGFSKGSFCEDTYRIAYDEILKPERGKEYWKIDNFYIVSILKNKLDTTTEDLFLKHIMNNHRGIYYIYDKKLSEFPTVTQGKSFVRYLNAISMILDYETGFNHLSEIVLNINNLKDIDGLWDFGKSSKDDVTLPLSDNWRTEQKRKTDCTILVLGLLTKYYNAILELKYEKTNNI